MSLKELVLNIPKDDILVVAIHGTIFNEFEGIRKPSTWKIPTRQTLPGLIPQGNSLMGYSHPCF